MFTWHPCNVGSAASCAANSCCCSHCSVFADHFGDGSVVMQAFRKWMATATARCFGAILARQRCTCAATTSCMPALYSSCWFFCCLCRDPGDGSFSAGAMAVLAGHSSGVQHQLQVLLRAHYSRERVTQAALQALTMLKLACFVIATCCKCFFPSLDRMFMLSCILTHRAERPCNFPLRDLVMLKPMTR